MVEVVAALIWDDDKFMICQRPAHKARALLWEFVGGKVEPGETKEQALIRECREELAVTLSVGDVFMDVVHEYPDITVHLTLFNATIREGIPQKLEHNDIQWITPAQIPNYDFCPADEEILLRIIQKAAVKKTYNKLVRDKIPEIIESDQKTCVTRVLSQEEYLKELRRKLDEEVQEYHESGDHEELADILEVVYALAAATGCTEESLNAIRQEKAQKRGGFSKRILLETVEQGDTAMTEKLQFFTLVALLLFLVGGTVYAAITTFRQVKQLKAAEPDPEETPSEPEYAPVTVKATVTDMGCAVKTEGWKTPKTVREFMVVFQTEDGQRLSFPVPEEMYDGFEKGQTGTLTVIDGQLYGFQPNLE